MRTFVGTAAWLGLSSAVVLAAEVLSPAIVAGWQTYISATEARVAPLRGQPLASVEAVDRGQVLVEKVRMTGPKGDLDVPAALVNHWRGVILIPGARLDDVMWRLEFEPTDTRQQEVLASKVLSRRPGFLKVSLRVHRSLVLSAVFDTEHEVFFQRHNATRASSQSTATKIVEIENAGTPREREKGPNEDRGLLWRWNAYWRYEQVEQGVIVECESVTLSRHVPFLLRPFAEPLVNGLAKDSMERTLIAMRERFRAPSPRH